VRAIVFTEPGGPLTLTERPAPVCPPDGVLIAVRATGVCRSDWHGWRGHDPVPLPHVPGHEFAGEIAAVGPQVRRFRVGERVTVPFVCGCGRCAYCAGGDAQVCPDQTQPGFTHDGSFADLVAVHTADFNLVRLPDSIDFVAAASLGCRFATAYRAVAAHGRPAAGDWVAVHGCGGVGLSAVMIAKALGAKVIAVDISPAALARATELGADAALDSTGLTGPEAVADGIHRFTGGGAQVSLDALGSAATALASVLCLRRRGRHVQVGLLLGADAEMALPMDRVIGWELSVHGSHGMAARDYPELLALITEGRLDPVRLLGRTIGLDRAGEALAAMDSGTPAGMTMVLP
jgi:alcohol dehydrogenase